MPNTVKLCPGCGTETMNISGCDHIKCVMKGCSVHWCYFCGERFPEKDIYPHMSLMHGGYCGGGGMGKRDKIVMNASEEIRDCRGNIYFIHCFRAFLNQKTTLA